MPKNLKLVCLEKKHVFKFLKYIFIRFLVFVIEKRRPIYIEYDKYDLRSKHFVLMYHSSVVGGARSWIEKDGTIIGRICVLKNYRRRGFGSYIIKSLIKFAKTHNKSKNVQLGTEVEIKNFYKSFGFYQIGKGKRILRKLHIRMTKAV